MAHLITGYAGYEHIQSEDDGAFNAAFFGNGQYVMESGNHFEGSIVDNNTVRILDGDLLMYGRHVRIKPNTYEDLTISTGTAGTNRYDLICMTYEKNTNDGTEKAYLEVIQGTESEGTAVAPEYIDGNILEGAIKNQMPLFKVGLKGVVLSTIEALFVTIPTYKTLAEKYAAEFRKVCKTYLDSLGILDTMEEVQANTQEHQLAGALAIKEMSSELKQQVLTIENCYMPISGWYEHSVVGFPPYRAEFYDENITSDYVPNVYFNPSYIELGILSTYASSHDGYIRIYANEKPSTSIYFDLQCIKSM